MTFPYIEVNKAALIKTDDTNLVSGKIKQIFKFQI